MKLAEWVEMRGPKGEAPPLSSVLHTVSSGAHLATC